MKISEDIDNILLANSVLKQELDEQIELKNDLQKLLDLERIITEFSSKIVDCSIDEFDAVINEGLASLSQHINVDRTYVFLFSEDGKTIDNTHEWCAQGIKPEIENLKGISLEEELPWYNEQIKKLKTIMIPSVEDLPEEATLEREHFKVQGIRSLVTVPMSYEGSLIGFIGFDSVKKDRIWDEKETERLTLMGQIISGSLRRLRAETNVRKMEQYFRAAFDNSGVAMIIADAPDGNISYINDSVWEFRGETDARLTGITIEEYIGTWKEFYPDGRQYTGEEMPLARSIISGEVIVGEEVIVELDDGTRRWALANSAPITDIEGKIVAAIVSFMDITQRKNAEKFILEAKIAAEEANISKSKFLANMSHELRTPLNAIIGFTEVLIEGTYGNVNAKQDKYLNNVLKSGEHLLQLINLVLDLSKVEAGKMELRYKRFKAKGAFEEVNSVLMSIASKKHIDLKVNVSPDVGDIEADPDKLKQILYNLLSNALKFTPNGGSVTLNASIDDQMLKVVVLDTGIGISDEDQNKLFEPFVQIDSSTSREFQGTGLGLSLVKKLVQLHKGNISLESELGKGTKVCFEIPTRSKLLK